MPWLLSHQDISRHGIDPQIQHIPSPAAEELISNVICQPVQTFLVNGNKKQSWETKKYLDFNLVLQNNPLLLWLTKSHIMFHIFFTWK